MAFAKPYTTEEQKFILKNRNTKTYGQIALEMAKIFPERQAGAVSPDGIRDFVHRYESENSDMTFTGPARKFKERFSNLGLSKVDVDYMISACLDHSLTMLENNIKTSKPSEKRGRATGKY